MTQVLRGVCLSLALISVVGCGPAQMPLMSSVEAYDVKMQNFLTYRVHLGVLRAVWSPDGSQVAVVSSQRIENQGESARRVTPVRHHVTVYRAEDGEALMSWDLDSEEKYSRSELPGLQLSWNPEGTELLLLDGLTPLQTDKLRLSRLPVPQRA